MKNLTKEQKQKLADLGLLWYPVFLSYPVHGKTVAGCLETNENIIPLVQELQPLMLKYQDNLKRAKNSTRMMDNVCFR